MGLNEPETKPRRAWLFVCYRCGQREGTRLVDFLKARFFCRECHAECEAFWDRVEQRRESAG